MSESPAQDMATSEMPATEAPMATAEAMPATEAPMATADSMPTATQDAMEMPGSMETPAWFSASLTDARSGEVFTVNDFAGKVVLVETLAQWCSNCLKQQKQVLELHSRLGERDDFISLGLDIDPNEDIDSLKGYLERNGFHWTYSVAPPEVARRSPICTVSNSSTPRPRPCWSSTAMAKRTCCPLASRAPLTWKKPSSPS